MKISYMIFNLPKIRYRLAVIVFMVEFRSQFFRLEVVQLNY